MNALDIKSWNDLDSNAKETLLPLLGEAIWLDDWEKGFVREIWKRGDGSPLSPAHLALMNELVSGAVNWIVHTTTRRPAKRNAP
jgi:hypothetical protein